MKTLAIAAAAVLSMGISSVGSAADFHASAGWMTIAPGVVERIEDDGSTTRMAFGDDGARYDLAVYQGQLDDMYASGTATQENIDNLQSAIEVLRNRVDRSGATFKSEQAPAANVVPILFASPGLFGFNNTPTPKCGFVAHQLADFGGDASTAPGGGGGTATASVVYYGYHPGITSYTATIFASATVTGAGAPITSSGSTSAISSVPVTLFKRSATTSVTAFAVSASTSSYIDIAACAGGYQSYAKSQAL